MQPTWLFVWRLERPPPLLWQPQTPRMASKDCVVGEKKGDLHAPFDSRVQQNGPLHGPMFAQKHPYMRRRSTPPSTPPQTPAPESRMPRVPPLFLAKFVAKKAKRAPRAPLQSRAGNRIPHPKIVWIPPGDGWFRGKRVVGK